MTSLGRAARNPPGWLAGLIAADGNISPDLKRVSLAQSGARGHLLIEEVRRITAHTGAVSATQPPRGNVSYSITIGSTKMVEDLRGRYGITPRKSLTYEWPHCGPELVCTSVQEARYHGRHAWAAAIWLYADAGLFRSAKQQTFIRYRQLLRADPPKWHVWAIERQRILTLLRAGKSPTQVAAETGLPVSRVYEVRQSATE